MKNYSIENLITKLKHDNYFNPFGHQYDGKKIKNYLKNIKIQELDIGENNYVKNILRILPVLARFNQEGINEINRYIDKINIPSEELIELIMAYTNHYFARTYYKIMNEPPQTFMHFENLLSHNSTDVKICEALITYNNLFFNYLNYYKTTGYYKKENPTNITLNNINKLYCYLQILCSYKDFYETCLFEKYNIEQTEFDKNIICVAKMNDSNYSKIRAISDIRQSKYRFAYLYFLDDNKTLKTRISSFVVQKIKLNKIKNISVKNNHVNYELEITNNSSGLLNEYHALSCFVTPFYHFMMDNQQYFEIINDYLILYSKFQDFFKQDQNQCNISDIKSIGNLKNIPVKINKSCLEKYLIDTTIYSQETIQKFLKTLVNKCAINFFKKPLLLINDDYMFHLLNTTANVVLNNIDDWLEMNNLDLQERGTIFEAYVKNKTKKILENKNYKFFITDDKKLKNSDGTEEEIDLIVDLENIILILELKCIKYPIENHDIENAKQRLLGGVEQILRKKEFLQKNCQLFKSKNINAENKEIMPLVITNNPNFTGLIVNNVPIIDFELFNNYVNVGKFITAKIDNNSFKESQSKVYYDNQREFEANIKEFMNSPIPLQDIEKKIKLSTMPIILNSQIFQCLNPKIFIERYN